MKEVFYKKVHVKSAEDLPKENGQYFAHWIDELCSLTLRNYRSEIANSWLQYVDWYLLPVDQEQSIQVTDEEINEFIHDLGMAIRIHDGTGFVRDWLESKFRDQIKPVDQEQIESVKFINEKGIYTDTFTTKCE